MHTKRSLPPIDVIDIQFDRRSGRRAHHDQYQQEAGYCFHRSPPDQEPGTNQRDSPGQNAISMTENSKMIRNGKVAE